MAGGGQGGAEDRRKGAGPGPGLHPPGTAARGRAAPAAPLARSPGSAAAPRRRARGPWPPRTKFAVRGWRSFWPEPRWTVSLTALNNVGGGASVGSTDSIDGNRISATATPQPRFIARPWVQTFPDAAADRLQRRFRSRPWALAKHSCIVMLWGWWMPRGGGLSSKYRW